jgi:cell wall-associated NlpC family hydrolase
MSFRFISGRRAAAARSNPFTRIASANAGISRQAAVILAASGLAFTGTVAANAGGAAPAQPAPAAAPQAARQVQAPLNAASGVQIEFDRTAVKSAPAPVAAPAAAKPAAKPAAVTPVVKKVTPVVAAAPKAAAAPAAPKVTVKAAVAAPKAPAAAPAKAPVKAAAGVNAAILASAYAQIGITQDCTAMVEKALGAAGIRVGDLAPMQFLNHGRVVSTPQPGDMVVQSGHVAIYAGNGKVISGGMNGINATMAHPLSWLTATGPVTFVRAA